jgi:hypothetical protein
MRNPVRSAFVTIALAVAFQLIAAGTARAGYIAVTASAVCDTSTGTVVIQYSATSLNPTTGNASENGQVHILLNDVAVAAGTFVAPTFSFSGSLPAPAGAGAGDPVVVTAVAVGTWEPGGITGGQSASTTVFIPSEPCNQPGLGRFTGGGHQLRVGGARVTRGLTVHCDLLLSNNLEVNWNGNQFHMTEHLTTVACSDDPDIIQAPPAAPLDTLVGVGTGRYNGTAGFTIEFTLVDAGEPGTSDQAALLVYETANPGNVVLNVPLQFLTGGNLQAHYDQPHR